MRSPHHNAVIDEGQLSRVYHNAVTADAQQAAFACSAGGRDSAGTKRLYQLQSSQADTA